MTMVKGCSACSLYSKALSRCTRGYVNPKTIRDGLQGMRMGMLKPCPFTEKGQKVIERYRKEREEIGE